MNRKLGAVAALGAPGLSGTCLACAVYARGVAVTPDAPIRVADYSLRLPPGTTHSWRPNPAPEA